MWIPLLHYVDFNVKGLIGVEWTLSVEVFWYALLPLMLWAINGRVAALLAIPVAFAIHQILVDAGTRLPFAFNVPPGSETASLFGGPLGYSFSFALGVIAYRLRTPALYKFGDAAFVIVAVIVAIYVIDPTIVLFHPRLDLQVFIASLAALCILFGSNQSYVCRFLLCNHAALFLGAISYGLYLSHLPISYIAYMTGLGQVSTFSGFAWTVGLCITVSTATYFLIERPTQNWRYHRSPRVADRPITHERPRKQHSTP